MAARPSPFHRGEAEAGPLPGTCPRSRARAGRDAKPDLEGRDSSRAAHTNCSFSKSKIIVIA